MFLYVLRVMEGNLKELIDGKLRSNAWTWPIYMYYSLVLMSNGAFVSYISLYYADISLNNAQIGLLTSAGAIVVILAQPFWGIRSDRAQFKNKIMLFCIFMSASIIWLVPFSATSFILLVLVTLAFNFFQCAVGPVSDTITLELASTGHFKFSRVRTVGSIGYALMAAIAGKIFSIDLRLMFVVYSVLMFTAFFTSFAIPQVKGHQSDKKKVNLFMIFKDKKIVYLYLYIFIIECTMWFFYTFHSVYSKQLGISTQLIGLGVMVGSFSQFPFMIFFDKIYKKIGILNIIVISGFIHVLRWILYATVLDADNILFLWLLHGCTYIVLYLCLAEYVNSSVIKDLKTSGQMMNALILQGLSKIVGSMVGGELSSYIGMRYTFFVMAAVCLLATAGFVAFIKYSSVFKVVNSEPDLIEETIT